MADNTAKIIDFERFRAARLPAAHTSVSADDSASARNAAYPLPVFCVFYVPYQPVVFWPAAAR